MTATRDSLGRDWTYERPIGVAGVVAPPGS